ncbi:MAG: elongation factor-1 alpha [Arcobacter sp.]|nr:MAG: elongation factor-1 alpha [Arcobacter sp.]
MKKSDTFHLNLPSFSVSVRTLFSGYLLVMGIGFLMAGAQILLTHGMADGKLGVSVDDIVYSYHGNRNSSKLEVKLNGSMKDKANALDRMILIKWAREGAKKEQWPKVQKVFEGNCIKCHSAIPGLPTFETYEGSAEVAKTDMGASIDSLTRVSHIHLFGIAFIFIFVGFIFSFTVGLCQQTKAIVISIPFTFLIIDIFSWWITKSYPGFAWFTIIGGFGYICAFGFMWFTSMYQMWVLPYNGKVYDSNEWDISQ